MSGKIAILLRENQMEPALKTLRQALEINPFMPERKLLLPQPGQSDNRETFKYSLMVNDQKIGHIKHSFDREGDTDTGYQAANLSKTTYYTLNDHLGSPQVLVNGKGKRVQNLSFSAWGERRAPSYDPDAPVTPTLDKLRQHAMTHGFTGHEHDDVFGFINMKGRLYDPVLGRFLSADPFVQFANNTQSYNRYSYVLNNPLSYTDPSGYFVDKILSSVGTFFRKYGRTIFATVAGAIGAGFAIGFVNTGIAGAFALKAGSVGAALAGGALGGFAGGFVATGSLEGAVKGALFGALSAGLAYNIGHVWNIPGGSAGKMIAHGAAQGVVSRLQGKKFASGFVGGFFGHMTGEFVRGLGKRLGNLGIAIRTTAAAVVGGTISKLTGGKFANGAVSAAFTHLFNSEAAKEFNKLNYRHNYGLVKILRSTLEKFPNTDYASLDISIPIWKALSITYEMNMDRLGRVYDGFGLRFSSSRMPSATLSISDAVGTDYMNIDYQRNLNDLLSRPEINANISTLLVGFGGTIAPLSNSTMLSFDATLNLIPGRSASVGANYSWSRWD